MSASLGVANTPTNIQLISIAYFCPGIAAFLDFRALYFHSAIIFISIGAVPICGLMAVGVVNSWLNVFETILLISIFEVKV